MPQFRSFAEGTRPGRTPRPLRWLVTDGYRTAEAGLKVVEAHWRPLAEDELGGVQIPRPEVAPDPKHPVGVTLDGLTLLPVRSELWQRDEPPLAQDRSGRYRLYSLEDNWWFDTPLRGRASLEVLRSGRPLVLASEDTVRLGEPGKALIYAFARDMDPPRQGARRLVVDGSVLEVARATDWDRLALHHAAEGITYLPVPLHLLHWLPCPENCAG